jgi:hypothetical protein
MYFCIREVGPGVTVGIGDGSTLGTLVVSELLGVVEGAFDGATETEGCKVGEEDGRSVGARVGMGAAV